MICTLRGRGTRAEDPFRGLRAGPVRSSPLFFFCSAPQSPLTSFFALSPTSQKHPKRTHSAKVCQSTSFRIKFDRSERSGSRVSLHNRELKRGQARGDTVTSKRRVTSRGD